MADFAFNPPQLSNSDAIKTALRSAGMNKLKSEMAGVFDAKGTQFSNDPHYRESQDAASQVSDAVPRQGD